MKIISSYTYLTIISVGQIIKNLIITCTVYSNYKSFYFQFTFDTTKLPKCMFNPDFRVSGVHFWMRKPDTMLCTVASLSVTDTKTTTITQRRSNAISRYENKFTESKSEQTIATMWLTLCLLVRYCLSQQNIFIH